LEPPNQRTEKIRWIEKTFVKNNQNNMGVNKVEKKQYLDRIKRLKERVLNTRPEMDLENAVLLTRGFKESEGQPLAIQKAYSFRKQCTEKQFNRCILPNKAVRKYQTINC